MPDYRTIPPTVEGVCRYSITGKCIVRARNGQAMCPSDRCDPPTMPQRKPLQQPRQDGFHWEEWRDGVLISKGWNDATEQPVWNASAQVSELCVAITATAIDEVLYGKKKK